MKSGFRAYLETRCTPAAVATRFSRAKSLEDAYGDLDQLYEADRFSGLLDSLRYTMADSRAMRPNPSKIRIGGDLYKRLAGLRNAVSTYRQFLEGGELGEAAVDQTSQVEQRRELPSETGGLFALERDLQPTLRESLDQLEPGLRAIDDGVERNVGSGYIDIVAEAADGAIVAIELKAEKARRDAIGQIMSYMGDLTEEEPGSVVRGILVAGSFDHGAKAAARLIPGLHLRQYRVSFAFSDPTEGPA